MRTPPGSKMKGLHTDPCNPPHVHHHTVLEQDMSSEAANHTGRPFLFHNQDCTSESDPDPHRGGGVIHIVSSSDPKWHSSTECDPATEGLSNGACGLENVSSHCDNSTDLALSRGVAEISDDLSLPEVCISSNAAVQEEDLSYEVQQAYRIFSGFLLDKHKGITTPFLHPIGQEDQSGLGLRVRGQTRQVMCLRRMEEKFLAREYETITEFVADFRLMLENCYRHHGVDHWVSKQAQKLEIMLEQKLTLLSRTLRERTTLVMTSKGRFGVEDQRGPALGGTSTRRRSVPRSLATITVGGHESLMVQALRLEEQQRVKEERRQRELEKKEAEETSAKEVEEWESGLLSQASPWSIHAMWELPAIGHFLCLAQTALNLPEIVFFELERCLLMPRCSSFLAKVMSSLLCAPQRRPTLHRRPALPYRRWEAELRLRVLGWYRAVGAAEDQGARAEQLGLDQQVFRKLGEVSPLEENPFHLLPFLQRVWLLKALCDNVYQTQKEVQDAVLGQPIHECRESILGYDSQENAYIHFPHFCGADLRIYCQSPSLPLQLPLPPVQVRRLEPTEGEDGGESDQQKEEKEEQTKECDGSCSRLVSTGTEEEVRGGVRGENGEVSGAGRFHPPWGLKKEEASSSDEEEVVKEDLKLNVRRSSRRSLAGQSGARDCVSSGGRRRRRRSSMKEEPLSEEEVNPRPLVKQQVKTQSREPCLSVGEHSYTGRSPARSAPTPAKTAKVEIQAAPSPCEVHGTCLECSSGSGSEQSPPNCHCFSGRLSSESGSESGSSQDRPSEGGKMERIRTKRKKRKRKRGGGRVLQSLTGGGGGRKRPERGRPCRGKAAESLETDDNCTAKTERRRKPKIGKTVETQKLALKKAKPLFQVEPAFKLVCTNLQELRELISRTEDELDDLESSKKRSGRWYFRREAVKDLHITLIRLLNELSPWEPKLIKAFHRNRLRLKKDHDDFRKHSEYDNFVREEWVAEEVERRARRGDGASSSSSSFSDCSSRLEEEEEEDDAIPRGLWAAADLKQFGTEAAADGLATLQQVVTPDDLRPSTHHLKRMGSDGEDRPALRKRCRTTSGAEGSVPSSCGEEPDLQSRPGTREQNPEGVVQTRVQTQVQTGQTPAMSYPRRYQPIPTLLAKSVGNKVTLTHRPPSPSPPPAPPPLPPPAPPAQPPNKVVTSSSPHASRPSPLASPQHSHPASSLPSSTPTPAPKLQLLAAPSATAPMVGKPPGPSSPVPKSPVQVVYQVPEALGQLNKDTSPVKISVQPLLDQNTRDKIMHQVVILPSNLLLHRPSEERKDLHTKTSQGSSPSKPSAPLSSGLSLPGGSSIPIHPVAPLKEPRGGQDGTPSPPVTTRQLQTLQAGFKFVHAPGSKTSTPQTVMPNRSLTASAVSTDSSEANVDPKQELKTICIRDSQSILVTTRGGNTGVVKVQASSDQSLHGLSPNSPVITISPQLKAFLVSKTSPPPLAPPVDPSSTAPSSSMGSQSQSQSATSGLRISTGPALRHTPVLPTPSSPSIPASSIVTLALNQGLITLPAAAKPGLASASPPTVSSQGPLSPNCPVTLPQSPSVPMLGLTQNALLQCVSSPAGKRAGSDDKQPIAKFILVTPTSNVTPRVTTPIKPVVLPGSKLVFVSQPTVCSSPTTTTTTTSIGSIPKQAQVPGVRGQPLTSSEPAYAGRKGVHLNPNVCNTSSSEVLSKVQSFTLPSGVPLRVPGQTPSSVTQPPNSPFCISRPGSTSTGLVLVQSTSTSPSLVPVGSRRSGDGKAEPSHCPVRTTQLPPPHIQDPAQVIKATPSSPRAMPTPPVKLANNVGTSPTQGATGTVQQRIVINTSAPLAAGTQILLNNTRFVVPPQGLGPGSHILIITSPAPTSQGASPATSCPLGSTLPGTLSPVSAPLPVCAPALVPVPTRLAGTVVPALAPTQPAQQGPRMTTPGTQPQQVALRLPATSVHPSIPLAVPRQVGAIRAPLRGSSTLSSSLPGSLSAGQVVGGTQSTVKHAVLPSVTTRTPVRAQLISTVQPIQALTIRTQGPPTAAVPPIGGALSRVQSLPIATVLPIGSSFNSTQVSPVAVVPPSNSTVITTPAQPIRTLRMSETLTVPVVLPNQMQDVEKPLVQVPGLSPVGANKLLVSPDGAGLNTVLGPAHGASHVGVSALNSTLALSPSVSSVRVPPSLASDGSTDGSPTQKGTGSPDL